MALTVSELKAYDGSDPSKPIYVGVKGRVFDVTAGKSFYGPGGDYSIFAGKVHPAFEFLASPLLEFVTFASEVMTFSGGASTNTSGFGADGISSPPGYGSANLGVDGPEAVRGDFKQEDGYEPNDFPSRSGFM